MLDESKYIISNIIKIIESYDPVIDDYSCIDPGHVLVKEECHVVFVLAIEVFLAGHVVTFGFGEQQVLDERDAQDCFTALAVGNGQVRVLALNQSAYGELRDGHADVVAFFHLYIIVEYGISISAVAATIIDTVKYKIEHLTGIKVGRVNVSVEDIRV